MKPTFAPRVDLHAHLFFHEGVGVSWFGSFDGPLRAQSWRDRLRSKVNAPELEASRAALVGVALYCHPLFRGSQRDSLRRQIRAAESFVTERSESWALVRSPEEAEKAYSQGKQSLLLTLEGAQGVLETEADFEEFIDRAGIRIVTPFHFLDDAFGGAALLPGWGGLLNPWAWLKSGLGPRGAEGVRVNPRGLTERGRQLVQGLLRRGVWIDFSHASDRAQADLRPLLDQAGQPHLFTHTMLREFYPGERGVSREQLQALAKSQGIVGVLPSQDMIEKTSILPHFLSHPCRAGCVGGLPALLTQMQTIGECIGHGRVTLGSDINAPLNFLPPIPDLPDTDSRGYFRYGQLGTLWETIDSEATGLGRASFGLSFEEFIRTWKRVLTDC